MKNKTLFLLFISIPYFTYTQTSPEIEWQNTIGGNGTDQLFSLHQTPDKGFILGGISSSEISGDKTETKVGLLDYWIVKLDSVGNIQWQNTIGGDESDYLTKIDLTADGGYIVGGYTKSSLYGDKMEENIGGYDFWIIKLDSIGNIHWQNTIGGTGDDYLKDIHQTYDGNYIAGGYSYSGISGDKTEAVMGEVDYWVVKLDSAGNIISENTIGGDMLDQLYVTEVNTESNNLLGGVSNSGISGDKTEESIEGFSGVNTEDFWIVLLTNEDSILQQNTIGGNAGDYNLSIHKTSSGTYILGGQSGSGVSGDKSESQIGDDDFWVMLLNTELEIVWQNTIGTTLGDPMTDFFQTFDGGYLLGGYTNAGISGDKMEPNYGGEDFWILKLDTIGNIVWQSSIGGNSSDWLTVIQQTSNGGYILGGYSSSDSSVDKTENSMSNDFWIVKLYPDVFCTPITFYADNDDDGFGNSAFSILSCDTPLAYVLNNLDCNDMNAFIHPDMEEVCNAMDDNCNFLIDEDLPLYDYYFDADLDGYGNNAIVIAHCYDTIPTGYVTDNSDCDDFNHLVFEPLIYYADMDGDFYGDSLNTTYFCSTIPPAGFVTNNLDCDDTNAFINPSSNEIENGIDDNCNDTIDEGYDAIENLISFDFQIYPNPNDGNFIVTFNKLSPELISIEIYSSHGEKIYAKKLDSINPLNIILPKTFSGLANIIIKTNHAVINKTICIIK